MNVENTDNVDNVTKAAADRRTFVIYHANCMDGMGAKVAAEMFLGEHGVTYIPTHYKEPFPQEILAVGPCKVYILDFSYSRWVLCDLIAGGYEVMVIDHHKTAQEELKEFIGKNAIFDMNQSGAVLAWKYFHPEEAVPEVLEYVQDRDLWRWELSLTHAINAAIPVVLRNDYWDWRSAIEDWERVKKDLAYTGRILVDENEKKIKAAIKQVRPITFLGYKVGVLNTTTLVSEIGNAICQNSEFDFSLTWFMKTNGTAVLSFRSIGEFDVSKVAETLGGGGHKNAAGATVSASYVLDLYK